MDNLRFSINYKCWLAYDKSHNTSSIIGYVDSSYFRDIGKKGFLMGF